MLPFIKNRINLIRILLILTSFFLIFWGSIYKIYPEQTIAFFFHFSSDKILETAGLAMIELYFFSLLFCGFLCLVISFATNTMKKKIAMLLSKWFSINHERQNHYYWEKWWLPILLFIGFALRLAWILSIPTLPRDDCLFYDSLAQGMAAGRGYLDNGIPTAGVPIGYPLFLAITYSLLGHNYLIPKLLNVIMGTLNCFIVYLLAKRIGGIVLGRIATVLLVFWPSHIVFSSLAFH